MSKKIGEFLFMIKKKIYKILSALKYHLSQFSQLFIVKKYNIKIMPDRELFDLIREQKKSLSRFGDGEIRWIANDNKNTFQDNNENLSKELKEILQDYKNNPNVIISLPDIFNSLDKYKYRSRVFWNNHLSAYHKVWVENTKADYVYGNSLVTRPYTITKEKYNDYFSNWKSIWNDKKILIIEGEKTRFGVGNDLLNNAKSIARIIAPAINAYSKKQELLNEACKFEKDYLILIALGPTATILTYELSMYSYQTIDIGHLDLEYDWYNLKAKKKVNIPGKYVNESYNKFLVGNLDQDQEKLYLSQINAIIL